MEFTMHYVRTLTFSAAVLLGSHALADDYPQPGLYKVVGKVSSDQLPVGSSHESEQCIKDDRFRTDPKAWMQEQQGQQCEVVQYDLSGGNINMELKCTVPGSGASTITGTGTYSSSGWQMRNVMSMSHGGMNMQITTEVTGTRQGSC